VARRVAHDQIAVFPVADQEWIVEKQYGKQKTHRNLPNSGSAAAALGLQHVHFCGLNTSTLSLTTRLGQGDASVGFHNVREEVGIIARGAMIPVVGSITEVQTLRVSEARFTSE
jgi:hypothetical protein